MSPLLYTMVRLGKEYGLTLREVQDCARKAGVAAQRGAAKLRPAQVEKLRPALASERRRKEALAARREENLRIDLSNAIAETQPIVPQSIYIECDCCQLRLDCREDLGKPLCGHCGDHYAQPGESPERELRRLRDHDKRMRAAFVAARTAADDYRTRLRAVYDNRDDWREAAVKLVIDHTEGADRRCTKCRQPFPCEPVRILSDVNRGFALKAEKLAGFSDRELEWHLHPNRVHDRDYALDDDAEDEVR